MCCHCVISSGQGGWLFDDGMDLSLLTNVELGFFENCISHEILNFSPFTSERDAQSIVPLSFIRNYGIVLIAYYPSRYVWLRSSWDWAWTWIARAVTRINYSRWSFVILLWLLRVISQWALSPKPGACHALNFTIPLFLDYSGHGISWQWHIPKKNWKRWQARNEKSAHYFGDLILIMVHGFLPRKKWRIMARDFTYRTVWLQEKWFSD